MAKARKQLNPVTSAINLQEHLNNNLPMNTTIISTQAPVTTTIAAPEFAAQNTRKAQAREFLNQCHTAEGLLAVINEEDGTTTYGFTDLQVWVPRDSKWINLTADDNDKFLVNAATYTEASSEFYARWRNFTQRVFKSRIFITALNRQ